MNLVLSNEPILRTACFIAVLFIMMFWEVLAPRRQLSLAKNVRWPSNLGLVTFNSVLMRLILPFGVMGIAMVAEESKWGLLSLITIPYWLKVVLAFVILDFVIYLQHVLFHRVPLLWRLHRVHHTDLDIDVTTGTRFHTLEIALSLSIKIVVVILIGAPALSVLIFEIVLNATSMFNHGNVQMPLVVDRILRLFVVTPDMHRVHHSTINKETNSNFGFNFPWWDRLLGTYQGQPQAGHEQMTIGLAEYQDLAVEKFHRMLLMPFRDKL